MPGRVHSNSVHEAAAPPTQVTEGILSAWLPTSKALHETPKVQFKAVQS